MLPLRIAEIAMFIGGIYAIVFAKVPSFLVSSGKNKVEGLVARRIGVVLILPLPIAFLGGAILPLLFGEESVLYAVMLELITVLGVAILSLVLVRVVAKRIEPVNHEKAATSMNVFESPTKISPLELTLYLVMAVTLLLGIWIRLMGVGWYLVFFGLMLIVIAGFHLRFQVSAIRRVSKMKPSYIWLILLSNLFFFLGFALQVDFGDQYGGYVALAIFYDYYFKHESWDYLMNHQPVELNTYMYASIAFLVALIVSWFLLRGKYFVKQENGH